ncbi:MAG: colanic acid biosynthesis glycosyltransferase WcaL, partial [Planctomycetes bacterium]|nr:colanic acid biosynthesis glycosyltransferase WcaL [Planctomycetota bacterium]
PRQNSPKVYDLLFEKGDLFTANTEFTKQQATKLGCPAEKIRILPMGLNLEYFKYKLRCLNKNGPVRILTVGRFVEKKGYPFALQAIAQLNFPPDSVVYDIAGDGPLREKMQNLAIKLNIKHQVNFLGSLPQDKILDLYHQDHIFLLPSVTAETGDMEGQGLVLQEAQATGLPVITTWHNGIPDGVLDGQSGFLVPERDSVAIAEKIRYLIENPQTWQKMGCTGRDFMEKNYDINVLNRKLVDIYQSAT